MAGRKSTCLGSSMKSYIVICLLAQEIRHSPVRLIYSPNYRALHLRPIISNDTSLRIAPILWSPFWSFCSLEIQPQSSLPPRGRKHYLQKQWSVKEYRNISHSLLAPPLWFRIVQKDANIWISDFWAWFFVGMIRGVLFWSPKTVIAVLPSRIVWLKSGGESDPAL